MTRDFQQQAFPSSGHKTIIYEPDRVLAGGDTLFIVEGPVDALMVTRRCSRATTRSPVRTVVWQGLPARARRCRLRLGRLHRQGERGAPDARRCRVGTAASFMRAGAAGQRAWRTSDDGRTRRFGARRPSCGIGYNLRSCRWEQDAGTLRASGWPGRPDLALKGATVGLGTFRPPGVQRLQAPSNLETPVSHSAGADPNSRDNHLLIVARSGRPPSEIRANSTP